MARILVIEDNAANLELMSYLLGAFGHTSLVAEDGDHGLEIAHREALDVVICDVQLPTIDGYEVARQLKGDAQLKNIPLIAVSALAMVGDRDRILSAGFNGYISKPIDPQTFVTQVEEFLAPAQRASGVMMPSHSDANERETAPPPPAQATLLVVDDTPINHDLIRMMLEPFGYVIISANTVDEAVMLVRAHLPALIVSDLHMPEKSGFDLLRLLKADAELQQIKVLVYSATIQSANDCREALALGAYKCLLGPIEPQILLKEIESILADPSGTPQQCE